jgi:hypothetical protein
MENRWQSKSGWVIVLGHNQRIQLFANSYVDHMTGKFNLYDSELLQTAIFSFILGHPKTTIVIMENILHIETIGGECLCQFSSIQEANEWAKFLTFPLFSAVPIRKKINEMIISAPIP